MVLCCTSYHYTDTFHMGSICINSTSQLKMMRIQTYFQLEIRSIDLLWPSNTRKTHKQSFTSVQKYCFFLKKSQENTFDGLLFLIKLHTVNQQKRSLAEYMKCFRATFIQNTSTVHKHPSVRLCTCRIFSIYSKTTC